MYNRKQIFQGIGKESAFLWGARQTGKSTLLKVMFPEETQTQGDTIPKVLLF